MAQPANRKTILLVGGIRSFLVGGIFVLCVRANFVGELAKIHFERARADERTTQSRRSMNDETRDVLRTPRKSD